MKFTVFFALLSFAVAVSVRSSGGHGTEPTAKPTANLIPVKKPDINVQLAGGAGATASGDQAVGTAADKDSGATGAKGSDTAFGIAGPGLAFGLGTGSGPDSTPGLGGIFNIFN